MKKLFGIKLLSFAVLFMAAILVLTSCNLSAVLPGDTPVGGPVAGGEETKATEVKDTSTQPVNEENSDSKSDTDQADPNVEDKDMYKFDGKYYIAVSESLDNRYFDRAEFTLDGNVLLGCMHHGILFTFNDKGYPEKMIPVTADAADESQAIHVDWDFNEKSLPEKVTVTSSDKSDSMNYYLKYDESGSLSEIIWNKDKSHNTDIKIEIKYSDDGKRTAYTNGEEDAFVNTWLDITYFADYNDKNAAKSDDGVYRFTFAEFDNMTLKLVELTPEQAIKIHRIASIPALVTSYAGKYSKP